VYNVVGTYLEDGGSAMEDVVMSDGVALFVLFVFVAGFIAIKGFKLSMERVVMFSIAFIFWHGGANCFKATLHGSGWFFVAGVILATCGASILRGD
jgi:hypothetical protein